MLSMSSLEAEPALLSDIFSVTLSAMDEPCHEDPSSDDAMLSVTDDVIFTSATTISAKWSLKLCSNLLRKNL